MSDFTKEELKYLLESWRKYNPIHIFPDLVSDIYAKIEFMIDNYKCHHESDGFCYTSNPPQNKCKKCGEFYR